MHSSCINSMLCLGNQLSRHCWNNNSKSIKRAKNYYFSLLRENQALRETLAISERVG